MGDNLYLGPLEAQCSHRSELLGLIDGLIYWFRISEKYNLLSAPVIFKCDRLEAIVLARR